ncbi:MAG: hypothetical protein CMG08_00360 [Candidatus Marinimicrobia bacterium]|nr:hypothetical protein [Candidatus Neomarinimicrobiota bacterium]
MKKIHIIGNCFLALVFGQSNIPEFNSESAFKELVKQCEFGPRNPGSVGHQNALAYFNDFFRKTADTTFVQEFQDVMPRTRKEVKMSNIIARFNPDSDQQIMISAHWDTRPWAENSISIMRKNQPIIGANDGASGVAVILELAKTLKKFPPQTGVNLVLFDAEDYGSSGDSWSYCKGSQFFAQNVPFPFPQYAINLDMVADKDPQFYIERYSYQQNSTLVLELWEKAASLNLTSFKKQAKYTIFDDHVPLYQIAGIPAIDIIDFDFPNEQVNYHHTHQDIVENCSPKGLGEVGTLMLHHIYGIK